MKVNKRTLIERAGLQEVVEVDDSKAHQLHKAIDSAIEGIDDSLSYKDFADAVAMQLKDAYGKHNYKPFMDQLQKQLR
tara:strand:+ start:2854 stop:3087 length:234 start_codon:yes stop_codon:yes gene_type:complete